jgi:hypothetical protein
MGIAAQLNTYLTLSGILFAIGSFGFLARRNAISMLMSIELMLNAVNLAIVAFGAFIPSLQDDGRGTRPQALDLEVTVGCHVDGPIDHHRGHLCRSSWRGRGRRAGRCRASGEQADAGGKHQPPGSVGVKPCAELGHRCRTLAGVEPVSPEVPA